MFSNVPATSPVATLARASGARRPCPTTLGQIVQSVETTKPAEPRALFATNIHDSFSATSVVTLAEAQAGPWAYEQVQPGRKTPLHSLCRWPNPTVVNKMCTKDAPRPGGRRIQGEALMLLAHQVSPASSSPSGGCCDSRSAITLGGLSRQLAEGSRASRRRLTHRSSCRGHVCSSVRGTGSAA